MWVIHRCPCCMLWLCHHHVSSFCIIVIVHCHVASSLCVGASSSCVLAMLSTCVVVLSHRCLDVSEGLERVWDMTHQTGTTNDDQCHCSSFGCHIADGNMAPGFHMKCV